MGNSTMIDRYGRNDEERQALKRQLEAVNAEAYANWDNPVWRKEMAADLTETIYWGFQHENLLNLYTQVENVDFNGRSRIVEARGLRAFWVARGGHIEASDMHEETFEITRDTLGFHVFEMEDKLRTSFGETQSNLVNLGIQRMDSEVNLRVLAAFQAAVPSSSPYYISANGLSLPALNLALRQVRDVSLDFNLTILGRSTMTDQIIDALMGTGGNTAGFFPETNERLLEQGVIGATAAPASSPSRTTGMIRTPRSSPPTSCGSSAGTPPGSFPETSPPVAGAVLVGRSGNARTVRTGTSLLRRVSTLRDDRGCDGIPPSCACGSLGIAAGIWPALPLAFWRRGSTSGALPSGRGRCDRLPG